MSNVRITNRLNYCDALDCSHVSITHQVICPPNETPFEVDVCREHANWQPPEEKR